MSGDAAAITGLGAVSGYGWGVDPLWRGLLSGRTAIGDFRRFDHSVLSHPCLRPRSPERRPAAAASRSPTASRSPRRPRRSPGRACRRRSTARAIGLFFGSSTGGMFESEEYFARLAAAPGRAPLDLLVAQQPSGPGDAVARELGVRGPVETIASACASATLALGAALEALRSGEIDVALVGGSDSLCRLTFAGFNALRAVDERPCRPFRRERLGMSIGEGAAVLVLERADHLAERGAPPLAWLAGVGASCDAHHMTSPDPHGDGIGRAVAAALADAGLDAATIDFVNLHGTGTPANDAAEAKMLASCFGERAARLPATSTKAAIGHFLGAAGAIEALVTVLCLRAGLVHPTPGEGTVDPALGVDLVVGEPREIPGARRALSTNLAFGGANAACVLLHPEAR